MSIDLTNKKIAVLMGGPGSERKVSHATGAGVVGALRKLGAEVTEVDVIDGSFPLPADVELAFNAIHGTFGEDGQVQRVLEPAKASRAANSRSTKSRARNDLWSVACRRLRLRFWRAVRVRR